MEGALLAAPLAFPSSCRAVNALAPEQLQETLRAVLLVSGGFSETGLQVTVLALNFILNHVYPFIIVQEDSKPVFPAAFAALSFILAASTRHEARGAELKAALDALTELSPEAQDVVVAAAEEKVRGRFTYCCC